MKLTYCKIHHRWKILSKIKLSYLFNLARQISHYFLTDIHQYYGAKQWFLYSGLLFECRMQCPCPWWHEKNQDGVNFPERYVYLNFFLIFNEILHYFCSWTTFHFMKRWWFQMMALFALYHPCLVCERLVATLLHCSRQLLKSLAYDYITTPTWKLKRCSRNHILINFLFACIFVRRNENTSTLNEGLSGCWHKHVYK